MTRIQLFFIQYIIPMIPVYVNNNYVLVPQTASVLEACETVGVTVLFLLPLTTSNCG